MSEYKMDRTEDSTSPHVAFTYYRNMPAAATDGKMHDEVQTTQLPAFDFTRESKKRHPIGLHFDGTFIADQSTWIIPVVSAPRKVDKNTHTSTDHQNYLSLAIDMIKGSGIYAIGAFASPLVALVLTPFLTHHLSITDYGAFAILNTVIDLVTLVTQFGLIEAFFRAYNGDYELERDRAGVLATSVILLVLTSIPTAIAMILMAPWLSEFFFNSPAFSTAVILSAALIVLENLALPGYLWLRAEKRVILFTILSIGSTLLVLFSNLVIVGVLQSGLNGALLSKVAGFALTIICTLPVMLLLASRQKSLYLRLDIARNLLSFGVPYIFSNLAAWILQLSDRYLLSYFGSLAQTASYTVAYTLGGVISPVVLTPIGLAWVPIMYSIAKREDAAHVYRLVFRWYSMVLLFAAFALSLLSIFILELLFPPAYHSAEPVIPIITLSTMLNGANYIFMTGVYIRRKTKYSILFTSIAAGVNVLLNIFLIPRIGIMGAAYSTLIAYIVLVTVTYIVNQKIYPVKYEIGQFLFRLLVGIALYTCSSLLAENQKPPISWSISIAALMLYGAFLIVTGGLSPKKLTLAISYLKRH
jgi:O-antigen/teichoic acid export membrane protein